jgi:phosphate starvation-inducible PhoH-like protein
MQKKRATSSTKAAPKKEKEEAPKGPLLEKNDFKAIKFTHSQLNFFKTIKNNFLTVCTGPAGTAKTFVACYAALDLLREGSHKKIILARPAVEAGENLGFLPGSIDEKIAPYMEGYTSNMEKILTSDDKLKTLLSSKAIDMQPLAFMRSRTFDDTILILDEAQNADLRQIMLVVTRMGQNSRIVICGDITQWDIKNRRKDLLTFYEKVAKGVESCANFEFTREDIVRNPILVKLTDNYDAYKDELGLDK